MNRQCWLINLRSGDGKGLQLADQAREYADVVPLQFERLEEQLRAISGYERLVIAGGDGTFSSVLTSMACPDIPAALVPIGTANDLTRDLGTFRLFRGSSVREIVRSIDALREGHLATWNCLSDGQVHPFCNYLSLGFEGAIVTDFDTWRRSSPLKNRTLNRLMYVRFALRHLGPRLREMSVAVKGENPLSIPPTRGVLFSNVRSHMGCGHATKESTPIDDTIECTVVSSVLDYARMVGSLVGLLPHLTAFRRGSDLQVYGIPHNTPMQIDGEPRPPIIGGELAIHFRKFVRVLVP